MQDNDEPDPARGATTGVSTSTGLLERVKKQDPDAWRRFVKLYGPLVLGWCRRSGLQTDDAADVMQEVFRAVLGGINGFHRDRPGDSFRGWLWTTTRNKIRDHARGRQREPKPKGGTDAQRRLEDIPEPSWDSVSPVCETPEDRTLERRAIELVRAGVETRTWEAFWRVCVEGRSAKEVAQELQMTTGAVFKAKYRVLRLVRDEYQHLLQ